GEVPARQDVEGDVEAEIDTSLRGPAGVHVGLHAHQEHRVEAFALAVGGISLDVPDGGPPWHRPGGVEDEERRRAVGMAEGPCTGMRPDKAAVQRSMRMK